MSKNNNSKSAIIKYGPKNPLLFIAWVDFVRWAMAEDSVLGQFVDFSGLEMEATKGWVESFIAWLKQFWWGEDD